MTAPAITIGPDALLAAVARRMDQHHIRMLPVADADGGLLGVVTRRNLLSVFLRTNKEIVSEVRAMLRNVLLIDDRSVTVSVRDGVVTLAGHVDAEATGRAAVDLAKDVLGVVDVINKLSGPVATGHAPLSPEADRSQYALGCFPGCFVPDEQDVRPGIR